MLLGSADDRVGCTVQVGYFTRFADMELHKSFAHSWQGHLAALPRWLEMADLVGARCPLPTMVQSTRGDALFTLAEVERGLGEVAQIFRKAGAPGSWAGELYDGPHKFDAPMQASGFAFFDRWLRDGDGRELAGLRATLSSHVASTRAKLHAELSELEAQRVAIERQLGAL